MRCPVPTLTALIVIVSTILLTGCLRASWADRSLRPMGPHIRGRPFHGRERTARRRQYPVPLWSVVSSRCVSVGEREGSWLLPGSQFDCFEDFGKRHSRALVHRCDVRERLS